MKIKQALKLLQNEKDIAVNDKTFVPELVKEVHLESGEVVYWIIDGGDLWLSIAPDAEEVIFFNTIDENIDASMESVMYNGEDYELSLETQGKVFEEDEEVDQVIIRDFQSESGDIFRAIEYTVTNEVILSFGRSVTEDELQEA